MVTVTMRLVPETNPTRIEAAVSQSAASTYDHPLHPSSPSNLERPHKGGAPVFVLAVRL